ncbi:hypothetical protein RSOLAG22IIIB_11251 [Rhizoctonia solani]|uniref:tyrosinase n=1 Tax=Rhizoctonia solani TaxID=456999 RepID=A0A0K6G833_9AGAM|nr:hypothetical protein RSOLAG22IIIB_11251 [Rhizoctonia solani]
MPALHLITGVLIPNSSNALPPSPPVRMDVCDLKETCPKQFTLFLLSWMEMMKPGFEPKAAAFQEIAGIHGMPYEPWLGDTDEVRKTARGPNFLGYCEHGSIFFAPWHRPYLMLMEQTINDVALGIASRLACQDGVTETEAQQWITAATVLRLPFWDWTHPRTGEEGIPEFFTTPKIELLMPQGKVESYDNPLACFWLNHPVDGFVNRWETQSATGVYPNLAARAYFREWKRTYRNPDSRAEGAADNYAGINDILKDQSKDRRGSWKNLTTNVAGGFVFPIDIPPELRANAWDEYSNTTFQSAHQNPADPKQVTNHIYGATTIEQPHNTVHLLVGGIGHMADNDTSGFDPIFYLHHCNIDRLLAFWEHIYPDYVAGTDGYLNPDGVTRTPFIQKAGGTWTETNDQVLDDHSPLQPFRNLAYGYWTSQDAHSLMHIKGSANNKGYTYPPIVYDGHKIKIDTDPKHPTPIDVRDQQRRYLQNYFNYDPIKAREESARLVSEIFVKRSPYAGGDHIPGQELVERYRQFFISVSLDPKLMIGSYFLVVLLKTRGTLTEPDKPYEIGRVGVLSRGSSDKCGNCQGHSAAGTRVRGMILVPHELVAKILVDAKRNDEQTTKEQVIETIEISLDAVVLRPDGTVHSRLKEAETDDTERTLSSDRTPYVQLLSSEVYQQFDKGPVKQNKEDVPYSFKDWQPHDALHKLTVEGKTVERHWVLE